MVALKGYFDESGKEDDPQFADTACSVAGYVASSESWNSIETNWRRVLDSFEIPYLHMKEFAHSKKGTPFESWKDDQDRRKSLLTALTAVISDSDLLGVCALVQLPDLRRFNLEHGLDLSAYSLGMYACLLELSNCLPNISMETVWDKVDKHGKHLARAREYADSDTYYPNCGKAIEVVGLRECLSSKDIPALQIADLAAYELLKSHRDKKEWFSTIRPNVDYDQRENSQMKWYLDGMIKSHRDGKPNKRTHYPNERMSYLALFRAHNARPMNGFLWDYDFLCNAHKARRGRWF